MYYGLVRYIMNKVSLIIIIFVGNCFSSYHRVTIARFVPGLMYLPREIIQEVTGNTLKNCLQVKMNFVSLFTFS